MLVSPKAAEATKLIIACIILCIVMAVSVWAWRRYAKRVFSPPESGLPEHSAAPAQLYRVTLIVAAPQRFPFGTILGIPGYSKGAVVQDRGGAIKGNRLDVLFPTHEEAKHWGVQNLKVRIVE